MNPTLVLKTLLRTMSTALLALPLAAQTPPTDSEVCAPVVEGQAVLGPIREIHTHLCGFHFYSGDLKRSLRVEHYCSHLNPDLFQCVIYDSDQPGARLIGIEYVISEALFTQLPAEEKPLWHSHRYEVMSGLLTAPELSAGAEEELMRAFVSTYGKTWHLWQVDRGDTLPLGLPKLMMGFTADGQADSAMIAARDRETHVTAAQLKARRAEYVTRPIAAGADGWQQRPAKQISDDLLKTVSTARQR